MKKTFILITCTLMSLILCGCEEAKEKTFTDSGFTITLTEDFYKKDISNVTNFYESDEVVVTVIKEEFEKLSAVGLGKDSSITDYTNAVINNLKKEVEVKKSETNEYYYFTYDAESNEKDYYFLNAVFKSNDAFWLATFTCEKEREEKYHDYFIKWAGSIKIE